MCTLEWHRYDSPMYVSLCVCCVYHVCVRALWNGADTTHLCIHNGSSLCVCCGQHVYIHIGSSLCVCCVCVLCVVRCVCTVCVVYTLCVCIHFGMAQIRLTCVFIMALHCLCVVCSIVCVLYAPLCVCALWNGADSPHLCIHNACFLCVCCMRHVCVCVHFGMAQMPLICVCIMCVHCVFVLYAPCVCVRALYNGTEAPRLCIHNVSSLCV